MNSLCRYWEKKKNPVHLSYLLVYLPIYLSPARLRHKSPYHLTALEKVFVQWVAEQPSRRKLGQICLPRLNEGLPRQTESATDTNQGKGKKKL